LFRATHVAVRKTDEWERLRREHGTLCVQLIEGLLDPSP